MIAVRIERSEAGVEGSKRQYAPYVTTWTCPDPACGAENELDHTDDWYFSYPVFGVPKEFTLCCRKCDAEDRPSDKGVVMLTLDAAVLGPEEAMIVMPRTEAMICIDTLRKQASVFADAKNAFAAEACRMLSERLYKATHPAPSSPKPDEEDGE